MASEEKELYEFGSFRLDADRRLLLHNDEPVPLQLKAFETLLVLVRNSQQVVLKDELMRAVWPDTFVEESNLAQNIFVLRKALAASSGMEGNQRFITTIPGRGYRFTESVRVIAEEDALILQRRSKTHLLIEESIAAQAAPVSVATVARPAQAPRRAASNFKLIAGAIVPAVLLAAYFLRPRLAPPRVTGIHQITHLGLLVHNTHLLTDGPRVYFRVWNGKERDFRSVSTEGGDVFPVQIPIPEMDVDDISPNGSEFLIENLGYQARIPDAGDPYYSLWRVPVPTGSPHPTGIRAREATWAPDGRSIAYTSAAGLFQSDVDGNKSAKIFDTPDEPFYLGWSPDGKHIRFSAGDSKSTGFYLWDADVAAHTAAKLIPNLPASARPWTGGWTPDGKYFFYTAVSDGTRNICAIREKSDFFHRTNSTPVQLTNGPFTYYLPLPAKDGKRLFVVAETLRGALLRYDAGSKQYLPYAGSPSADYVAYSPDGQWMAYVELPDWTLVRSRPDGSERQQLTYLPLRAYSPRWSPDGTQIAFQGFSDSGGRSKIYLISSSGSVPRVVMPSLDDRQIYPSWTSDGNQILFSNSDVAQTQLDLRIFDLKTKQVSVLPGSDGLTYGQLSPDGRYIIAVERATHLLILYDTSSHSRRALADVADYPRWSRDGKFAYFNNIYFSGKGRRGGINRWNRERNQIESMLKYPDFLLTGAYGVTFSLMPDNSILVVKDVSNRDLYSLDLDLP